VNVIKIVRLKSPLICEVFDLKLKIGRDPGRLDWGKVSAYDIGGWVLIGKVNCPNSCTGSKVKHFLAEVSFSSGKILTEAFT
jgi:hypothetical protein